MAEDASEKQNFRIVRDDGGIRGRLRALWAGRFVRWLAFAAGGLLILFGLFWLVFARDLPDADALLTYEPPLPTIVRDGNGQPIHSYARERRVQLQYSDFPPQLIAAYLSAEDKTFFDHHGVDFPGFAGAVFDYVTKIGSGRRAKGGSTITQQVAKNLLIGDAYSPTRKVKEMILAWRMEDALTKHQILELYLNEIFLGRNAYGVQAAARAYFDRDVADLTLPQMAYLAILPKGPSNYRPESPTGLERALDRRNWALGEMEKNGYITASQRAAAQAEPLGTVNQRADGYERIGGYYMEEVRRRLIDKFGESAKDGPNSIYAGGLWVRTPIQPFMQAQASKALRNGLLRYDAGHGWSGPLATIDPGERWASELATSNKGVDHEDWRVAAVLSKNGDSATIGFRGGSTGTLPASAAQMAYRKAGTSAFVAMKPGDLIVVKPVGGGSYALRNIPAVSGGMMIEDVHHGRVLAMQGGFDSRLSSYNRVTQAMRQPGSTIKPFVYSAALDNGMTPASIVLDGSFCIDQGGRLGRKCFRNFDSRGMGGSHTMRWGIEQSRNLMTVRTASQTGMDRVVRLIKRMGIGDYSPYLAVALGSGDTTVERLVNAYAMLANQGRRMVARPIDYVQDRHGRVIWPDNWRPCDGCNKPQWDGRAMPRFAPTSVQAMNPMTAYQMVHITEGVVQRGTATVLADLKRPLFGKTGTTSGPTNVWFVGGSPDIVAGVYLGYDQPRSLGGYAQGGRIAAPIWKEAMKPILDPMPVKPFVAPAGIRMVRIDRQSGRRIFSGWPTNEPKAAIIWEAFKPDTEPKRSMRLDEMTAGKAQATAARRNAGPQASWDFAGDQGGIY
ncbi:transglycosylase domain-containing protein [Sphingobium sufflavum]|uniref:penicillin-binding protein 1A n=1 Tax=Sphingobium sufflavum TaxID=1129547 RepID=UPI001F32D55E|nr:transglycosylase domain-containing protein [Sphingobium sufflavum]MCE7797696.1 transglycosylase domain-containing protein [Sphingobium sufflavum]